MLLMLLLLPAGMVAQSSASSSKYIATYESSTQTLTFEKYEGESLPENSAWVVDKKKVFAIIGNVTIKHIVFDKSFSTYTPTSLYCFFENLTKLETITGLEYLNTAKVTNMSSMFSRCSSLASLDVTHFNTANVTNMRNMFSGCSSLTSLDVTHFNTANVTDMSYMFSSCSSLTSLDVTYFNTENVTNMSTMFSSCSSLTSLDVTKFNTANVTDMYRMFKSCGLTSLDLSNFNTAKVTNMELMFSGCSNLKTIYASDKFITAAVTKSENMFSYCGSLSGDIDWSDKATDKTYAKIDGGYLRDKAYDNRPWVKYADGTLTFRCGYKKTLGENEYLLNSDEELPKWNTHNTKISKVVFEASFANARPTSCYAWFQNFIKLKQIEGIENLNTENVTNMKFMFKGCSSLTSLDVTHFNTGNVTSMSGMFDGCSGLISLDVTNFNTANVTDMSKMFFCCYKLKEIYVSDKFVTDDVISSAYMFMGCSSLSGDIDWISVKVSDKTYAKTAGGYFRDKAYDNRPWVKYADGTLTFRCGYKKTLGENEYALNSGEEKPAWETNKKNISKVVFEASFANARPTNCYAWFQKFNKLKQIEGIENLNTENVTDMSDMFYSCSGLISLDVTHFNTANVTSMRDMFDGCSGLTSLDVTNFNTAHVTDMSYMFYCCYKLKEIYVSDKFVTDDVISSAYMFMGCSSLSGDIDWISVKVSDKTYAKTAGGYFRDKAYDNRPWVKYADGTLTFRCGYKKTLGENEYALNSGEEKPAWETNKKNISKVVFEASFANARPTNCYAWFQNFENLKQIEGIENLNTANVTDMSYMFKNCSNLAELDVTHFNTAKVTTMNGMFSGCSNLTELDLTHFNTENVTNMWLMFYGCESLTTIYVSDDFVITNITYKTYSLFYGCEKLKGAIDKYDNSKIDGTYANYKTGYFTKLVGKNGDEKIGAAGEPLATDNLVLDDDKDFVAYEPFAAKAASYSRKMKEGTTWATLCLPFEVSLADKNFRAFKLLSADEGTETVELEEIEGSIAAGTPVIIKMKDGATELNFTEADKTIAKDVQTAETADANYKLQGLYTQKMFSKDTDNNCYIVKGDKLMNPAKLLGETKTESVGSKPFRAYMVDNTSASAAGARMFSISVGGSTTAIEQLETTADSKAEYYDLQGRRLQNLQKGVNIVKRGGKTMKVIIK